MLWRREPGPSPPVRRGGIEAPELGSRGQGSTPQPDGTAPGGTVRTSTAEGLSGRAARAGSRRRSTLAGCSSTAAMLPPSTSVALEAHDPVEREHVGAELAQQPEQAGQVGPETTVGELPGGEPGGVAELQPDDPAATVQPVHRLRGAESQQLLHRCRGQGRFLERRDDVGDPLLVQLPRGGAARTCRRSGSGLRPARQEPERSLDLGRPDAPPARSMPLPSIPPFERTTNELN